MTPTLPDAIARVERLRDFYNDDRTLYSPSDKADMAAALTRVLAEVQRLREALQGVLAHEAEVAQMDGYTGCGCINWSRDSERAYENGRCPHQIATAVLETP